MLSSPLSVSSCYLPFLVIGFLCLLLYSCSNGMTICNKDYDPFYLSSFVESSLSSFGRRRLVSSCAIRLFGFLKLVHDLSSRNSSRAFGVCTTRHRSIETTLLGLLPMPLSSVSPTRASKPTRLSSGTIFYLLCSFLVLYRPWPLIKGLAFPLSSIVTGWLCPPIVSMNRFLNFPSLRNELSSYLIPKQDSTSEQVIIIVSQQVTSS